MQIQSVPPDAVIERPGSRQEKPEQDYQTMIDRFSSQMQAMQMLARAQELTADNLANINTPGFKGSTLFYRLVDENLNGEVTKKTVPFHQVNLEQGILEMTGNTFDLAVSGEGFFVVEEGGREYLTRDGRFQIDSDGFLVNSRGSMVQGSAGAIHIPADLRSGETNGGDLQVEIAKDGSIRINGQIRDQIQLVSVDEPASLQRNGNSYFSVTHPAALREEASGEIMQGYYEKGNVDALHELTGMMKTMQMFESQQRAMNAADEVLSQGINNLGRY